jgi:hypothetical protein
MADKDINSVEHTKPLTDYSLKLASRKGKHDEREYHVMHQKQQGR